MSASSASVLARRDVMAGGRAVLLGAVAIATTLIVGSALADTLLTSRDEVPGLGEIRDFVGQACTSPDGALFAFVRGVEGKEGLICIDESGAQAVVRTGDPAPPDRAFSDVEYGHCSFTDNGEVVFSATTPRPVIYPDGSVQHWAEAAIYKAGPGGIVRLLGTGDRTKSGATLELFSSVRYSANSAGDVLAYGASSDGFGYFLVDETGVEKLFSSGSLGTMDGEFVRIVGDMLLTDRGDIISLARIGYPFDIFDPFDRLVVEWSDGEVRVVATPDDIASDGLPYGKITDLLVRGDVAVFKGTARFVEPRGGQSRLFIFSPESPTPELVFAGAAVFIDSEGPFSFAGLSVVDANANGEILFASYTPETDYAYFTVQRGGEPKFATSKFGPYPLGLAFSDQGTVYSIGYPFPVMGDPVVTLEADLGTVAGTSCSILPTTMPDAPAPIIPTPTATPPSDNPDEPDEGDHGTCAGDCGGDGVVTVSDVVTVVSIALGRSGLSRCSACDADASGDVTVDEAILAVNRALLGCR